MNYIFHPDYEPTIVDDSEYLNLLSNGWYDSPAKFPKKQADPVASAAKPVTEEDVKKQLESAQNSLKNADKNKPKA